MTPTPAEDTQTLLAQAEYVACRICGKPTPMKGTQLCDRCCELECRIHRDIGLAERIIKHWPKKIHDFKPNEL